MAIEPIGFPIENGEFPKLCPVFQRVSGLDMVTARGAPLPLPFSPDSQSLRSGGPGNFLFLPRKEHWLVVYLTLTLWKIWQSVGMILLNIWENIIKCSKPPTCHHPILHVKDGVQSSTQRFSWEEGSLNYPPDPTAGVVLWGNSQKRKIFEAGFLHMLHSTCSKSAQHPHPQTYFVMLLSVHSLPPHGGFLKRDYTIPKSSILETLCSITSINIFSTIQLFGIPP